MASAVNASFTTPLYGPLACQVGLLRDDAATEFRDELKLAEETGWKLMRNEPFDVAAFYKAMPKDGRLFPVVARLAVLGAIDSANLHLFDRVRRDMTAYAKAEKGNPHAALAMQLVETSVRLRLRIADGYPDWLPQFDFAAVPTAWHPHVAFLGIKVLLEQHRYEAALAASGLALAVNARHDHVPGLDIWLSLFSAICCRETQRYDEADRWFRRAASEAEKCDFVVPFLEFAMGEGSSLDVALKELAPKLVDVVRQRVDAFYLNAIKVRNHLTGGHVTEKLTRRQFFIARHVSYGASYKEIADMLGLSLGRVRNLVSEVYQVLGIHNRGELTGLVW